VGGADAEDQKEQEKEEYAWKMLKVPRLLTASRRW